MTAMAWVWPVTPDLEKHQGQKSEASLLDHVYNLSLTTRDAPFGTDDTPVLKDKIIGGRYVSVIERPTGETIPRYEKLSLVSDKPNYVDPQALSDFYRKYNKPYQDPFIQSKSSGRLTNLISKRPDSKDIFFRYPTLPPIEENRLRNMQIFPLCLSLRHGQKNFMKATKKNDLPRKQYSPAEEIQGNGRAGVKALYNPRGSGAYGGRQPDPVGNSPRRKFDKQREDRLSREEFKEKLMNMLPKNVFLPEQPLVLTKEDEVQLLEVLAEEMAGYSPLKLRDIYLDIANTADKQLSGYCQYQDLYYSMSRQMFNMPADLLQVTAAMFVSSDRPTGDVDYERFLSFLGLALKHAEQKNGFHSSRLKTPVVQQVENYFSDSEQAKLVSTVEQQLHENDYIINFGRLEHELSMADNVGRGTLDLRTIMDVCYQLNIPLQSSVLNRVLSRCRLNSYEDAYNWKAFIEFLQKAQPGRKPEPVYLHPNPPVHQPIQQHQHRSPPNSRPVTPLWRRDGAPPDPRRPLNGYDGDERDGVISRMDQDIRQLERNYEEMRERLRPKNDTPWFKNFMEFANALYKLTKEQRWDGDLPADEVYKWTKMYNETCNLGFPEYTISKALSDSSKSGKVNIHSYLTKLGNVHTSDKI
ncbi:uncharacterized protein LOC112574064 isoform X1 [Pomacea canaliculata]|uniref:uncharacterized protein LOC112574064 isoform X1 n=1 Tax=Pomacea canaliculata TaxID=400727 RepID=UPI000D737880|nr:uncharacterized protein LOC112574064 isoform X1 [Pomacea canaliculata]